MTFKPGSNKEPARSALERFAEKCRFDPLTGCVLWTGGTTAGRGNSARYGSFWYEGNRWYAHRWAAIYIHGINLGENQAGHTCPCGPNTLCVEHVTGQTQLENLAELNGRLKAQQSAADRQHYLFIELGIEPEPPKPEVDLNAVPFYDPPQWLKPYLPIRESEGSLSDDCPF